MHQSLKRMMSGVQGMHIDFVGSLQDWYLDALDNVFWNQCIEKLRDPNAPAPQRPNRDANFNPRRSQRDRESCQRTTIDDTPDDNPHNVSPPRGRKSHNWNSSHQRHHRPSTPSPDRNNRAYIPENVGKVMYDSLRIFDLGYTATMSEVTARFRAQARIYHPDKHDPERTRMSQDTAKQYFQMLGNAREYLKSKM